ncbi:MAG: PAS domain S-box protein [Spirochaetia bacterium]|nr:PAS domain S-box protein [Spirochaetia bacterium]
MNENLSQHLKQFFELLDDPAAILDEETEVIVAVNPPFCSLLEMNCDDLIGMHQNEIEPDSLNHSRERIVHSSKNQNFSSATRKYLKTKSGKYFGSEIHSKQFEWNGNSYIFKIYKRIFEEELHSLNQELINEVELRKMYEKLHQKEKEILKSIALGNSLEEILNQIITSKVFCSDSSRCSLLLLDHKSNTLHTFAAVGLPDFYNEAIDGISPGPSAGSCGTAAYTKEPVIVEDICTNPLWNDYRHIAEKAGLRACWSLPILNSSNEVLGTFAVYYDRKRKPNPHEIEKIESAANLAGIAIEKFRNIEKITSSEERWRVLVESIGDSILTVDRNCCIQFVNHLLGRSNLNLQDIIGKNIINFIADEDRGEFETAIFHLFNGTVKKTIHMNIRSKNSKENYAIRMNAIYQNQKPEHIIIIATNITDLTHLEKALAESEYEFKKIFENAPYGMVITRPDGSFKEINPAFSKMLGYSVEELKQMTFFDITPPEDREISKKIISDPDPKKHSFTTFEKRYISKNGRIVWVSLSIVTIFNSNDEIDYFITQVEDITEKKNTMEEKEALKKKIELGQKLETIGRLAGGIAHDFNNILTPILLVSEMMLLEKSEDPELEKSFTTIRTAALRAKSLIRQIMHFSKGSGESIEPVRIDEVIFDVMDLIKPILPSQINLQTEICAKSEIWASPVQIHQVIMNLCMNSLQAIGENSGTIKISLYEEDLNRSDSRYVCLKISDTGCGILKDDINKIFDPFYTTKEGRNNIGMGLSVVHGIINNYNGEISFESEVNAGTTFTIKIPAIINLSKAVNEKQ